MRRVGARLSMQAIRGLDKTSFSSYWAVDKESFMAEGPKKAGMGSLELACFTIGG